MPKMNFSTEHLQKVFAEEGKYDSFRKICYNLNHGIDIYEYDDEGNEHKVSKKEANKAVQKVLMEVCELNEETVKSEKKRTRMLNKHHDEVFELIEEDVDFKVETGFRDNEWFLQLVDYRNLAIGDDIEFYKEPEENYFEIAETSGDHHDYTRQYLGEKESFRIHTKKYAIKVGKDIDLILLGRIDFTEFTDKVARSWVNFVMGMIFEEVYTAADELPNNTQFKKTGAIAAATKEKFDTLIEDVELANDSPVVIMGSKVALKKLNAYSDVNWRPEKDKEMVSATGRLGDYEGTVLVEIPQRFKHNDVTQKLIPNNKLLIFPTVTDKFIKMTDVGETMILERGREKGDRANDTQTYEVQRAFGVGVLLGRYFGQWTIDQG